MTLPEKLINQEISRAMGGYAIVEVLFSAKKCPLFSKHRVVCPYSPSYLSLDIVEQSAFTIPDPSEAAELKRPAVPSLHHAPATAFGSPRDFLDNRFVYTVVSARARGLSVGVNMNPDKLCNFNCIYCEVHRNGEPRQQLNVEQMAQELRSTLSLVRAGRLRERPWYRTLPDELLQLRHVALSGDGEPTLSARFSDALEAVVHVRALGGYPFKLVLITNGTGLDLPHVLNDLKHFTRSDEIWIKLDGGTQAYLNKINRCDIPLGKILANILMVGRRRPVVIQSLFPSFQCEEPPLQEIEQYAQRLLEIKNGGANISLVQIYSATRPSAASRCDHLPLKVLSRVAQIVRQITGLRAEVF